MPFAESISNRDMSHAFGATVILLVGVPAAAIPSAIPGESATILRARRYAYLSSALASIMSQRLRSFPLAIGISGHRSRTSKTTGVRRNNVAITAGIIIVSGVLV